MGESDTAKLYYCGEGDGIEGFLYDFESYSMSKNWNEATKCRMVCVHVPERMRTWIRELIKTAKDDWEETVREYINRFEAYMEPIKDVVIKDEKLDWFLEELKDPFRTRVEFHCPKKYDNAREWALQVENYRRKKECKDVQKDTVTQEEVNHSIQSEIDELTAAFSDIKINRVDQPSIKREEIESIIKEVLTRTKKGKDKNWNQASGSRVIKCFSCYEEGHMARNCPKQNYPKENKSDDV
ncbi:28442_t:CDS:2 [Dentiscutata erythropus]|uniref:28442_t:CDS:1 n=1 Tax=Dentiscutata erythropus TaxID=1348616 RepID=A0A9N9AQ86_9GLOM|nr:28442_t:CDS:2 [Dentiscutata erythropus]